MSRSPEQDFSPEQQHAYGQIAGFFARAEYEFPAAAGQLVNVVGGLVGEQRTTQRKLQEGMENIDVGLALIGDWLREAGADGFKVKLGLGGGAKKSKSIARKLVPLPDASSLIEAASRGNPRSSEQIQSLLSLFSMQVWRALDVGLSPRQIVGGLVAESVGSRLSANGSEILREALKKPLAGHFEWIREALGIPDAAIQPGFTEKETLSATAVKRDEPTGKKEITPAKKELPAFLTGDELPEGYQWVDFPNGSEQEVALGEKEGSTVLCYVQGLGVRLTRGPRDTTYVQLLGIPTPYSILSTQKGIPLSETPLSGRDAVQRSLYLQTERGLHQEPIQFEKRDWRYVVTVPLQAVVRSGGTDFTTPDFGYIGVSFSTYPAEGGRGNIWIRNENINYGSIDRIAIPSTAIVRGGETRAEAQRRVETEAIAAQTEAGLTSEERMMIDGLGIVAAWERNEPNATLTDFAKFSGETNEQHLQTTFRDLQFSFYLLPADSRLRSEIIKSALGQLGETGEKLKKAGKSDEEIFAEWLRQVFLALYQRALRK